MLDIGMSEMLIVGVVALIVVGPKDLPKMFHTLGEIMGKARGMAREFQRAMDVAAKEAGVGTITKDLRNLKSGKAIKDAVGFDEIDEEMRAIGRDMTDVRKSPDAKALPNKGILPDADGDSGAEAFDDESGADEIEAASHDAEMQRRNDEMSAVEAARLEKARKTAAARRKAASIRAKNEANEASAKGWQPNSPAPKKAAKKAAKPVAKAVAEPAAEPAAEPDAAPTATPAAAPSSAAETRPDTDET